MALIFCERSLNSDGRFIIVAIIALGVALSFSFFGGTAAAEGRIPFFKNSPVVFAVTGGISVFVIVILICWYIYLKPYQIPVPVPQDPVIQPSSNPQTNLPVHPVWHMTPDGADISSDPFVRAVIKVDKPNLVDQTHLQVFAGKFSREPDAALELVPLCYFTNQLTQDGDIMSVLDGRTYADTKVALNGKHYPNGLYKAFFRVIDSDVRAQSSVIYNYPYYETFHNTDNVVIADHNDGFFIEGNQGLTIRNTSSANTYVSGDLVRSFVFKTRNFQISGSFSLLSYKQRVNRIEIPGFEICLLFPKKDSSLGERLAVILPDGSLKRCSIKGVWENPELKVPQPVISEPFIQIDGSIRKFRMIFCQQEDGTFLSRVYVENTLVAQRLFDDSLLQGEYMAIRMRGWKSGFVHLSQLAVAELLPNDVEHLN